MSVVRRPLTLIALALALAAAVTAALLLRGGDEPVFQANGCQKGFVRLSDEYVRELRLGSRALDETAGAKGEEAEREAEGEGEIVRGKAEGKGYCLNAKVRLPETFKDLMAANGASFARLGLDSPKAYARAARQKDRLRASGIKGTGGTWSPVGNGPVVFDNPDYQNTNNLAAGLSRSSGRISDYAYDAAGARLFASVAQGGVWMSGDKGITWKSVGEKLPTQIVGSVAWTPSHGGRLLALTGDNAFGGNTYAGQGIYWTDDLGATWHKAKGAPDGAMGSRIAVREDQPTTVYAATGAGLYRSSDAGETWKDVGLPTGDCAGKTFSKPTCFFANNVTDVSVMAKDDFGHTGGAVVAAVGWRQGQRKNPDGSVQAPNDGIYTSDTGDPGSFAKTPDSAGFTPTPQVGRVALGAAIGPQQNHAVVYAAVQDSHVFDSQKIEGIDAAPAVPDPTGIVGGNLAGPPSYFDGVYVSQDFGKTWTAMAKRQQFYDPASGSALSALIAIGYGPGVQSWYNLWIRPDPFTQVNGIPTRLDLGLEEIWETRSVGTPQVGPTDFQSVAPYANTGALTAGCILSTTAAVCQPVQGAVGSTIHPDQHAAIFLPGDQSSQLVVGNDGGSYHQTVPAQGNLQAKDFGLGDVKGFNTLLPYSVGISKSGTVYAGLQDNGTVKIDPKDNEAYEVYGGDGTYVLVDPDNPDNALVAPAGGSIAVTHDGGRTNTGVAPAAKSPQFLTPFVLDDKTPKRILYAARDIWIAETSLGGLGSADQFTKVFDMGTRKAPGDESAAASGTDDIDNVASAAALSNKIGYIGFCGSCDPVKLNVPFHGGVATNVSGKWKIAAAKGLPQRLIASIAIDPDDTKTVYVGLGESGVRQYAPPGSIGGDQMDASGGYLYRSTDGGETFTDISGDLPKVGVSAILVHGDQLLAGTTVGAFSAPTRRGGEWGLLGDNLPAAPVYQMVLQPGNSNRLVAATFGRGVWSYEFKDPPAQAASGCADKVAPVSKFTAKAIKAAKRAGRKLRLSGTSSDRGCLAKGRGKVKRITVSIARAVGKKCRYLQASGKLARAKTSCLRTRYLPARGTTRWSFTSKRALAAGQYKVWVRGVDAVGNVERKKLGRNGVVLRLR